MSSDHKLGSKPTPTLVERLTKQVQTGLKECTLSRDFQRGLQLHSRAAATGLSSNAHIVTSLIKMYSRCGNMQEAKKVFDTLLHRDVVSWTALIMGYVENGESYVAFSLFERLAEQRFFLLDSRMYVAGLSACSSLCRSSEETIWLEKGRDIHLLAEKNRCCDVYVESALIDLYSRCGSMTDARRVFDSMNHRNVVSWTVMMQGYMENGESELALKLFDSMDCLPDPRTFVVAIMACGALGALERESLGTSSKRSEWLERGRRVHARAFTSKCCNLYVQSSLVDMYGKCGSMSYARRVFDSISKPNVVSWTSLVQGYVENGESEVALELFDRMQGVCTPNDRTYVAALSACATLAAEERAAGRRTERWLETGKALHSSAVSRKCCTAFVENTLVNMYSECGSMAEARTVFDRMAVHDVVSWNSLLHGYVNNSDNEVVLDLVAQMDLSGVALNSRSYLAAIMACESLMAVEAGRVFVEEIANRGLDKEVVVANSLVNFYGKSGCVEAAKKVFDSIEPKTIVSWTSLMCGYGLQGASEQVLQLFESMKEQGVQPDEVTFICVLSACSHAGLTNRGKKLFDAMLSEYGVAPNVKHYACMIDLLSRANKMEETMNLVKNMPMPPDVVTWTGILSACSKWRNLELGELAFESVLKLDKHSSIAYVLMANLYSSVGMRDECSKVLDSKRWIESPPSSTVWTDEAGKVHKFTSL